MAKNKSKHRNPLDNPLYQGRGWQSAALNDRNLWFYQDWLYQLAASRFEWTGLPKELDQRYMELTLNGRGLATFFWLDEYDKFFCTSATPISQINIYSNPKGFLAYGSNGWSRRLKASDCVPIWNNYTRVPTVIALELFAQRLANIDRTIQVNLANQRHPVLVTCSEEQRLTIDNLMKQAYGGEPVIIGDTKSLTGIDIGYLKSDVPYISDKLMTAKKLIWNEVLTYLGINNSPVDKAERVQSAEVDSNNEQIEACRNMELDCRRFACEEINRRYELDVNCVFNRDFNSQNFNAIMSFPAELLEGDDA